MNHYLLKSLVAVVVVFVLLYYGVAWAVLRCSHDAEHSDHAVEMEDVDATRQAFHRVSVNAVDLDLECGGPDFHTEAMAEASSPPQLGRLTPDTTRNVNDLLTLRNLTGAAATAVFETSPSRAFLIGLPSYLFLSILRI
jgi:hypothetical protein